MRGEPPEEERFEESRNRMDWRSRRLFDQTNISIYTWSSVSLGMVCGQSKETACGNDRHSHLSIDGLGFGSSSPADSAEAIASSAS
jgi:hypothetical protein